MYNSSLALKDHFTGKPFTKGVRRKEWEHLTFQEQLHHIFFRFRVLQSSKIPSKIQTRVSCWGDAKIVFQVGWLSVYFELHV